MTNAIMQLQFFSLNNLVNAVNKVFKSDCEDLSVGQHSTTNK